VTTRGPLQPHEPDDSREAWTWEEAADGAIRIHDGEGNPLATLSRAPGRGSRGPGWTAALITRAPELLRYCRSAMDRYRESKPIDAHDVSELGDIIRELDDLERSGK
jgi:hypothetical protein